MQQKIDIVYCIYNSKSNELKYSLRSLELMSKDPNIINRVIIIGDKLPACIDPNKVIFIKYRDNPLTSFPHRNCVNKLEYVINHIPDLTENFIWNYDDNIILKETDLLNIPYYCKQDNLIVLPRISFTSIDHYKYSLYATRVYLETCKHTLSCKDCEIHTPIIFNKIKLLDIIDKFNKDVMTNKFNAGLFPQFRSLYCNLYEQNNLTEITSDFKVRKADKEYIKDLLNSNFISLNDKVPSMYLKETLEGNFSLTCQWEKK